LFLQNSPKLPSPTRKSSQATKLQLLKKIPGRGAARALPRRVFMADDMNKQGGQSGQGQQGGRSGQSGQGQRGGQTGQPQQGNQSGQGQSGQNQPGQQQDKKGGQFNEEDDQNRDRQRRAS